jgi:molybdopterin synthase sulfur carrier subunit
VTVTLLYFAWVRERIGADAETVDIAAPTTVGALVERLAGQSEGHAAALGDRARLRAAVNQDFVGWDHVVTSGDEVAIFPPVTGG